MRAENIREVLSYRDEGLFKMAARSDHRKRSDCRRPDAGMIPKNTLIRSKEDARLKDGSTVIISDEWLADLKARQPGITDREDGTL